MPVISIFLSSTFRDFHAERDLLVGSVRSALDERVMQYGCRVEMIDLRWGVAADEADDDIQQTRVLDVCLSEIERAKPLFVGLVGDRFGWVPPPERTARVAARAGLTGDYSQWSVTALEFQHGALSRSDTKSVFFLRELTGEAPPGFRDTDLTPINWLRERIEQTPNTGLHRYRVRCSGGGIADLAEFEAMATQTLGDLVERRAQMLVAADADPLAAAIELFMADRTLAFAARERELTALELAVRQGRSTCLLGPSGTGKSAIWCRAVEMLRGDGHRMVAAPIGVSPDLLSETQVIHWLSRGLGLHVPDLAIEKLRDWFRTALSEAGPMIVAIDSLDTLDRANPGDAVSVIADMPKNVVAIVSTTEPSHSDALNQVGFQTIPVEVLGGQDVTRVVQALTDRYRRQLPPAAVAQLSCRSRSPLWLDLAVGELNALGEEDFSRIDPDVDAITALADLVTQTVVAMPDEVENIVGRITQRAEARFSPAAVADVAGLVAVSRSGLTPYDLAQITGLDDLTIAGIRRALAGTVGVTGAAGRLRFRHDVMGQAMWSRYVGADRTRFEGRLAAYLGSADSLDPVARDDALWHTLFAKGAPPAAALLASYQLFDRESLRAIAVFATAAAELDPLELNQALTGVDLAGLRFLTVAIDANSSYHQVQLSLEAQSMVAPAVLLAARKLAESAPPGDDSWDYLAIALKFVGDAAMRRGELDIARDKFDEAVEIGEAQAGALPDTDLAATYLTNYLQSRAELASREGDDPGALKVMERVLALSRQIARSGELDDLDNLHTRLSNTELLARRSGKTALAEELKEELRSVRVRMLELIPSEALPDDEGRPPSNWVEFDDEAIDPRSPVLVAARQLVAENPASLQARSELRMNLVMASSGAIELEDYEIARALAAEAVDLARSLTDQSPSNREYRNDLAVSLNELAKAGIWTDEYDLVDRCYFEALTIDREQVRINPGDIRAVRHLGVSLQGAGRISEHLERHDQARELFAERVALLDGLARTMGDHPKLTLERASAYLDVAGLADVMGDRDNAYDAYRRSIDLYYQSLRASGDPSDYPGMSDTVDDAAEFALKFEDYQFALDAHRAAANVAPEVLDSTSDPILIGRYSGHLEAAGRMEAMLGNDILAANAFLWAAAAFSELPKSMPNYKEARSILISQLRDIAKILQRERGRFIASAERRRLAAQCNTAALLLRTSPRRVPELLERE